MIDRIGDRGFRAGPVERTENGARTTTERLERQQGTPAASEHGVELSAASRCVLAGDAGPPIDKARIDAIRSAIASGNYPVDPHALAARMIAFGFGE
jgi:negative regulator of flagellin synthesis FlgM